MSGLQHFSKSGPRLGVLRGIAILAPAPFSRQARAVGSLTDLLDLRDRTTQGLASGS